MKETSNYKKHTDPGFLKRRLLDNFYKSLLATLDDLRAETILDVGCGEGFTLIRLKNKGIGGQAEGVDYSPEAIALGNKIHPSLNLRQGDVYALPYPDNSFDLVICTEVLEHLQYPEKALREIKRVSKRYCLFSVPNEPFFMLANFLCGKNISRWGNDQEHIQRWSAASFGYFINRELKKLILRRPFPWTLILAEKKTDEKS